MQRPEIRQGRGKQDQCSMQGKSFNKWCQAGSKNMAKRSKTLNVLPKVYEFVLIDSVAFSVYVSCKRIIALPYMIGKCYNTRKRSVAYSDSELHTMRKPTCKTHVSAPYLMQTSAD